MIFSLVGLPLCLAAALAVGAGIPEAALLFAAFVTVPLGLELRRAHSLVRIAQPFAAVLLAVSFALPPGTAAAALCLPWAAVCAGYAVWEVGRRIASMRLFLDVHELASAAFLPVGAAWTIASRAGITPMGFHEPIVLLTGVHFHYTGFAAPLLTGWLAKATRSPLATAAMWGVIAGTPLLAAGFTFSPRLQVVAALLISASLLVHAVLAVRQFRAFGPGRFLALPSALSVAAAMALAGVYALGEFTSRWWLTIPEMAASHGALNALGFVFCGLWAWKLRRADAPFFFRRPSPERIRPAFEAPEQPVPEKGWPNRHRERLGEGEEMFRRAVEAVRRWQMMPARIAVEPADPVALGRPVAVVADLGLCFVCPSRVVELSDGPNRFSFKYRTLEGHPLAGEEQFLVERLDDGSVWFEVSSVSAPSHPAAWLGLPLVRQLQRWFVIESATTLRAAVALQGSVGSPQSARKAL